MCQPKPGPRCSNHARSALDARRAAKDVAESIRNQTAEAFRSCDPTNRETRRILQGAAVEADKAYWEAKHAHTEALRTYETTPEGIALLEQAAQRLEAEGDETGAADATRRIVAARETRATQVADLAMSRRHKNRLNNPTVEELAALDQADADVQEHEQERAARASEYERLQDEWRALGAEAAAADELEAEALRTHRTTVEHAVAARDEVAAHAKRLYMDAGVSERFAGYYAKDMADQASRVSGRSAFASGNYSGRTTDATDQGPVRAMVMKVKRDGPDRDKTMAAKAAAETDPGFQVANAALVSEIEHAQAARLRLDEIRTQAGATIRDRRQEALRASATARYALEEAERDHAQAEARRADLRARIGSGLGTAPVSSLPMQRVGDEIVRNPDGSTNAYIYNAPSDGFPHGRYIPAVDVAAVQGMGTANALVLENGTKAWLHGHYSRTVRGAGETQSGYQHVVITAPQEGARPLREECAPTAGFYTFVDSSD